MKINRKFRCDKCGKIFDWPKEVRESRGEYWGIPCWETMYYSPCCTDDFEEITDGEPEEDEDEYSE